MTKDLMQHQRRCIDGKKSIPKNAHYHLSSENCKLKQRGAITMHIKMLKSKKLTVSIAGGMCSNRNSRSLRGRSSHFERQSGRFSEN